MNKLIYVISIGILFAACKRDSPEEEIINSISVGSGGLLIGSEGNFQFGNASLSYYDNSSQEFSERVFETVNGFKLGDVLQSISQKGSTIFLVINNSGKVELLDEFTFKSKGTIAGFTSPRYFLPVSNNKAYVTDLYANSIAVVDLNTLEIIKSIDVDGWTEQLTMVYGKVFVCNKSSDKVYVIDAATDVLQDSIEVSEGPNSIIEDKNGLLWVLCKEVLHQIDPVTLLSVKSFVITTTAEASQLNINGTSDTLYYLNNGVFQFPIGDPTISLNPIIESDSRSLYGLGIDPVSGDVYVSDAIDYLQKSIVFVYRNDGTLRVSFLSGINTSVFHF
jgi:YVTN family beta-propeller protein